MEEVFCSEPRVPLVSMKRALEGVDDVKLVSPACSPIDPEMINSKPSSPADNSGSIIGARKRKQPRSHKESAEEIHGRLVVQQILAPREGDEAEQLGESDHSKSGGRKRLEAFVIRWREFFLETMKPRHLPAGWDAHAKSTRAFGKHSRFHRRMRNSETVLGNVEEGGSRALFQLWDDKSGSLTKTEEMRLCTVGGGEEEKVFPAVPTLLNPDSSEQTSSSSSETEYTRWESPYILARIGAEDVSEWARGATNDSFLEAVLGNDSLLDRHKQLDRTLPAEQSKPDAFLAFFRQRKGENEGLASVTVRPWLEGLKAVDDGLTGSSEETPECVSELDDTPQSGSSGSNASASGRAVKLRYEFGFFGLSSSVSVEAPVDGSEFLAETLYSAPSSEELIQRLGKARVKISATQTTAEAAAVEQSGMAHLSGNGAKGNPFFHLFVRHRARGKPVRAVVLACHFGRDSVEEARLTEIARNSAEFNELKRAIRDGAPAV